uniref:Defender against cell death 1 n=1 Tax=Solanum tuberosum TaxID=4113 RepID=M1B6P5_SOLTU
MLIQLLLANGAIPALLLLPVTFCSFAVMVNKDWANHTSAKDVLAKSEMMSKNTVRQSQPKLLKKIFHLFWQNSHTYLPISV